MNLHFTDSDSLSINSVTESSSIWLSFLGVLLLIFIIFSSSAYTFRQGFTTTVYYNYSNN